MRKILYTLLAVLTLTACCTTEEQLKQRANELCVYIPDHELLERSRDFMTTDFYTVLDTMFYRLPEHEAMDHEWLYYFVTGNGGTIADYEVLSVEKTDATHAVATILVRQKWEDGSFDPESDVEEHRLYMESVNGKWLMSDFDEHKADCIRYIANNRKEQALRDAISDYLVREIGTQYLQGELCIPTLLMVAEEDSVVYGDFWVFWYKLSDDTLQTVSGGNHAGRMTIAYRDGQPVIAAFEQTVDGAGNDASAKRIFGSHYDIYCNMHSNADVREAVRKEQLGEYIHRHNIPARYYQDYGWQAVEL
ncbi:MAG: membrane lipoprotein lipid attachment site-containing protein [Paludibacteraceae bacterium]|nr:membrane lipoprotein lipid attachment site-containing protein [Paludibacteraceae bacterium]